MQVGQLQQISFGTAAPHTSATSAPQLRGPGLGKGGEGGAREGGLVPWRHEPVVSTASVRAPITAVLVTSARRLRRRRRGQARGGELDSRRHDLILRRGRGGQQIQQENTQLDKLEEIYWKAPTDKALYALAADQLTAYKVIPQHWKDENDRAWVTVNGRPGTGKTRLAAYLLRKFVFRDSKVRCAVVFAPTIYLIEQWKQELRGVIGDEHVLLYVGAGRTDYKEDREKVLKFINEGGGGDHIIIVASTAARRNPKGEPSLLERLEEKFEPDQWIAVLDEAHKMVGGVLGREDQCMSRKFLPHKTLFLSATLGDRVETMADYRVQLVIRPNGICEPKTQLEDQGAFTTICQTECLRLFESGRPENVMIFVTSQEEGQVLLKELRNYLRWKDYEDDLVHFITYKTEEEKKERIVAGFREGRVRVLISMKMMQEGVDFPNVSLVIICGADDHSKSLLRSRCHLVQMAGRAARHKEGEVIFLVRDRQNPSAPVMEVTRQMDEWRQHQENAAKEKCERGTVMVEEAICAALKEVPA